MNHKKIIFLLFILMSGYTASQSFEYLPGGIDFASRILGSYSLPIHTLGLEGALRNPSDYLSGLNINHIWYYGDIYNYIAFKNMEVQMGYEEGISGIALAFPESEENTFLSGWRLAAGVATDNDVESYIVNDPTKPHPSSCTFIFGFGYSKKISDNVLLNIGFIQLLPFLVGDFSIHRIDIGGQVDFFHHIKLNLIYRKVTSYSYDYKSKKDLILFPETIISSSYAIYHEINSFQFSIIGKSYTNRMDFEDYVPLLHFGYNKEIPGTISNWLVELFYGSKGRIIFGLNYMGFTFEIGKNVNGMSYNLIWLPGLFAGPK